MVLRLVSAMRELSELLSSINADIRDAIECNSDPAVIELLQHEREYLISQCTETSPDTTSG